MRQTPPEVVIATLSFIAVWLAAVLVILAVGRRHSATRSFRQRMLVQWKPALAVAAVYLLGTALGGRGVLNPYAIAIFCQALIGLALAKSIEGFRPLPVAAALAERQGILKQVVLLVVVPVLVVVPALLVGTIGLDIAQQVFGESDFTQEAAGTLPPGPRQAFFLLLSGAGIAEETPYRLVLVSLLWKATGRRGLAVIVAALVFGAYHLTPLNGMYQTFWKFPVSQFTASTLIGLVWGWLYLKRGYETVVLGHTFSNWLPMLIFS